MPVPSAFTLLFALAGFYFVMTSYTAMSEGAKVGYDTPAQDRRLTRILMIIMFMVGLLLGAWLH